MFIFKDYSERRRGGMTRLLSSKRIPPWHTWKMDLHRTCAPHLHCYYACVSYFL